MPSPPASRGWSLSQLWRGGEDMASKKDDDLGLPRHSRQSDQRQAAPKTSLRWTAMLRLAVYAVALFTVAYGLFRVVGPVPGASSLDPANLMPLYDGPRSPPGYDPPRMEEDEDGPTIGTPKTPKLQSKPSVGGGSRLDESKAAAEPLKSYNGPLKLPRLGSSLQAIIAETSGRLQKNRNVLFAAASLRSASLLLPLACQMAAERQNYVHFALMSRSEVPMKELLAINGIDKSCPLLVHDYVNAGMHPQAVIVDSSATEESYFLSGIRDEIRGTASTLIELPERSGSGKRLTWLSKLDASALAGKSGMVPVDRFHILTATVSKAWNDVSFDILIHAPRHGAGNLKRLLRSLARADLIGVSPPHMTIELPTAIDGDLGSFLGGYEWPPRGLGANPKPRLLALRHRIPRQKMSEEESSVRFLESFWPTRPSHSHVLVLSPHTEVTPQFFHYVKYSLLQRRYSAVANRQGWGRKLFGISFSVPTTYLDDTTKFKPPKPLEGQEFGTGDTPFLWQSPSSDAILIFGDKWVELHGYVSRLFEKQHASPTTPDFLAKKEVGKKHPAWLEYTLQLSRIRGYFTLYPTQQTADTVVGIHADLYDAPEEYEEGKTSEQERDSIELALETFDPASQVDMLATLPHEGDLPLIYHLPWLTWDGQDTYDGAMQRIAANYRQAFRKHVGECKDEGPENVPAEDPFARDLFCFTKGGSF
ncbi:glycosyltransferase 2 [Trichoderma cornu-damae]|uniref:Glycosyltransferase 2 n=1 Tax=Trichoderma cornu-damae TaxID=654480 RepID=A0A9P8QJI8_9HYPO|nr:glycosyltransferase 2 [Trichoderma cornu-damae]